MSHTLAAFLPTLIAQWCIAILVSGGSEVEAMAERPRAEKWISTLGHILSLQVPGPLVPSVVTARTTRILAPPTSLVDTPRYRIPNPPRRNNHRVVLCVCFSSLIMNHVK